MAENGDPTPSPSATATPATPGATPPSTAPLRVLLQEDFATHDRKALDPGLHALVVYRVAHWALPRRTAVQRLVWKLARLVEAVLVRAVYGTEISPLASVGRRVRFGHHQAVTIAHGVVGDDCLIRHGVGLGLARDGQDGVPVVGRGVHFGPFSLVMGPVTIGDDVRIGPHSVVSVDVPAGSTVFANPARVLKPR